MRFYNLTWDANACGIPATYFSLYYRREVLDREGNMLSDYTGEEVVDGGDIVESYITDTEYFVTLLGHGNTFALVAHNGDEKSAPKILAKNIDASATAVWKDGKFIFVYGDDTENGDA